ncbi:MAG TPA: HisA/HisF-related TIM barrel protein [Aggregatilineaceae bacterium]|nr:HisA/HisF-related TIM barrel protein [Aggregatilineaceae bacterium]
MIELTRPGKSTLVIEHPVMPAAGMVGFDGAAYCDLVDLGKIGALVTNPVTWRPRRVARGPRVVPLPSGVLVHTGLPNPGVNAVIKEYGSRWARSLTPVIVHVVATSPADVGRCLAALDRCEGVAGIEMGLHDQSTPDDIEQTIQVALDSTQLPLLVCVPLYHAVQAARVAQNAGAGGLVIAAPPRGTARDPETGQLVGGRVYGPWLKALALRAVGQIVRTASVPVVGSGGIHSADDARDFLEAGAVAVQVDTVIWSQPHALEVIARNLGGLELTRAVGALADEWEPGMGQTLKMERESRLRHEPAADDAPSIPPPVPPDLPE